MNNDIVKTLFVGEDASLLKSKSQILEPSGYSVLTATSQDLIDDDVLRDIDVVVLCHTLKRERAESIYRFLPKINPDVKFLWLCGDGSVQVKCEHTNYMLSPHPSNLLEAMSLIAQSPMHPFKRSA